MVEALIAADLPPPASGRATGAATTPPRTRHLTTLVVPGMHCGGCMRTIETALAAAPGVVSARANLSTRRVSIETDAPLASEESLVAALAARGFAATRLADASPSVDATADADLLRRLGVAGFAAANIMLLSVAVWSGEAGDMQPSLVAGFHWLSALIAVPAVAYAGQPFFGSARRALAAGRLNMDVPISLGVLLATGMSLYETATGRPHAYFDAAVTLVFFLLIGRVLDGRMRARAAGAALNLVAARATVATVIATDGRAERLAVAAIEPGTRLLIAAGERVPLDATVAAGCSAIDESLITGESAPRSVAVGDALLAGTMNLSGAIEVVTTAPEERSLLAEIGRLMAAAEQSRSRYVRLADRAAQVYAPAVHALGLATFAGWMWLGFGWEAALTAAVAVLIITCPCALALAVPVTQIVAMGRLLRSGIIVKAGDGLERLAEIDTVVLDKTGTLTRGEPSLADDASIPDKTLALAASLAAASRHPYSRAVVAAARARGLEVPAAAGVVETAGAGLEAIVAGRAVRLGSSAHCGLPPGDADASSLWLAVAGEAPRALRFADRLRPDAAAAVTALRARHLSLEILSGDRAPAVAEAAATLAIATWSAGQRPDQKIQRIEALAREGRRVLMVGDGLNDAPALAAGHASMSPSTAADISQTAADVVFQGDRLAPLVEAIDVARASRRRSFENIGLALAYNAVFVPLAVTGHITPLLAAIAMSASSLAVTLNALRVGIAGRRQLEVRP